MENECNLDKFRIILSKPVKEFKKFILEDKEELTINLLCSLEAGNTQIIIDFIKEDECLDDGGNILDNLLQLEPLSLPIVDAFIESGFLDRQEFITRVDNIRKITSHIMKTLQVQKRKIRNDGKTDTTMQSVEDQLKQVMDEIQKHQIHLKLLKTKKEKQREEKNIKEEIKELEEELDIKNRVELENKLNFYKNKKLEIDKIKKEIEDSQRLFIHLPKDGA